MTQTPNPYPTTTGPTTGPTPGPTTGPTTGRRLVRSREDRWLSGVCVGLADYTGLDANVVRLLVVLGTVLGLGSLVLVYVVAWVLMPSS